MSKIICDVCGTSYPETANQCPICGCVRSDEVITVCGDSNDVEMNASANYTYVKGGRFSKSNVKKRNQGKAVPVAKETATEPAVKKANKSDLGIVITIIVLLLAIAAIVVYMAVQFWVPGAEDIILPPQTQGTETVTTALEIPCKALEISDTVIELDKAGAAFLLNIKTDPVDTTDVVTYATADETVAVVTEDGKVVAVAAGETTITISCGEVSVQCRVVCTMEPPTEESTVPTYSTDDFKFNREDFTLTQYGQTHKLYNGQIPVELITWNSEDEKVATIKDAVVTAIGSGTTTVYGEYGDVKLSCVVRCSGSVITPADNNKTENKDTTKYELNKVDVSIKPQEKFDLYLMDETGAKVEATFVSANDKVCTVENGVVTGVGAGQTVVTVTFDGETHKCIVRVK